MKNTIAGDAMAGRMSGRRLFVQPNLVHELIETDGAGLRRNHHDDMMNVKNGCRSFQLYATSPYAVRDEK